MGSELWLILGLVVVGGAIFAYGYSKNKDDPLGGLGLGGLFQNASSELDSLLYDVKKIPKGTTIHPDKGESLLQWYGN